MGAVQATRLIRSAALDAVPHAFTTRAGGVSAGVFESLNLGNPSDIEAARRDSRENILENWWRVLAAMGCEGRELVEVHQVHGAGVHVVRRGLAARVMTADGSRDVKADAIVTDDPGRVVAVRVADCAPVLIASADGRVVAAVHAGWRGVVAGVVPAAIAAMKELGAQELSAAVGPCIGAEHFEVGPEVTAEFVRVFGAGAPVRPGREDRSYVDLKEAIRVQLSAAGVARIDVSEKCTSRDAEFFSHRREKGITGRMAGVIGAAGT